MLCGFPAKQIRDLLRGANQFVTIEYAAHVLGCSPETAREVIESLKQDAYLEGPLEGREYWELTLKGSQLRAATAAKPISRKTAERLVKELLSRVGEINDSPDYLMRVSCVAVFGSYLREVEVLSDLDIGYCLQPKATEPAEHQRLWHEQIKAEEVNGRRFGNIPERVCWPHIKVVQALRGRARSLSLEPLDGLIEQMPPDFRYKILYGELLP